MYNYVHCVQYMLGSAAKHVHNVFALFIQQKDNVKKNLNTVSGLRTQDIYFVSQTITVIIKSPPHYQHHRFLHSFVCQSNTSFISSHKGLVSCNKYTWL